MPLASQRLHSRRGHTTTRLLQWVNLVVVPHLGSIDSRITHALALWAASVSHRSRGLHWIRLGPKAHPFRGYVYPAQLPLAVFPPGTYYDPPSVAEVSLVPFFEGA